MPDDFKYKLPDGKTAPGVIVGIQSSEEHFNTYLLEDGTTLRAKLVALEVIRIKGKLNVEDEPLYFLRSQTIVTARALPETKDKAQEEMKEG